MNCSHTNPTTRIQRLAAALFLVGLLPAIFSHAAQAIFVIPIARVECMPEFGIVTISQKSIRGERVTCSLKEQPERIAEKYGIYDISSYFIFEGEDEDPPNPRIVGSRTKTIECQLAEHHVSITLKPDTSRPCPSAVTIRLTLEIEGVRIIENLIFERSCIQKDTISLVNFNEDGEFILLTGTFDDARKDELGVHFVEDFTFNLTLDEFRPDRSGQDPLSPLKTFEDVLEAWRLRQPPR